MKLQFSFLYAIGAALIAIFLLWRVAPTDLYSVTFAAEVFAVLSCAMGVTCVIAAHHFRREWEELTRQEYSRARAEAEAAVAAHVEKLEAELAAAREYISRMNRHE